MSARVNDAVRLIAAKGEGRATELDIAVLALEEHIASRPFDPERFGTNTGAPSIGDTVRDVEARFGFDRSAWPARLLEAAAPFDALAQIALGGVPVVQTQELASAIRPASSVRTHRPHRITGTDWSPALPADDLAIPTYGRTD